MNTYLEALKWKLTKENFKKLREIEHPKVHEFIAKSSDLCNAKNIFICSDDPKDISYIRQQAIISGEEQESLKIKGQSLPLHYSENE